MKQIIGFDGGWMTFLYKGSLAAFQLPLILSAWVGLGWDLSSMLMAWSLVCMANFPFHEWFIRSRRSSRESHFKKMIAGMVTRFSLAVIFLMVLALVPGEKIGESFSIAFCAAFVIFYLMHVLADIASSSRYLPGSQMKLTEEDQSP